MKPETVIKVENLSKQYRLGNVGLGSLGADVNRWWQTKVLGNEDPYLKIGEENNREVIGNSEYVWALRDINFEVQQGEVLGIIGRNGAGKSTLLKILSRTTGPTTGSIKIKGRVASLLEVGTGFHPELTGRENIFLNGAILGMTKDEIRRKFDEIVAFAGVERYVDTPVKRYSSGMYVRLAFAVAAHLEPEILIVDEVLAVGDAEFQKKAIGKMKEVSEGQGRTVLFVSHNMDSIRKLCDTCILLREGKLVMIKETSIVVNQYLGIVNSLLERDIEYTGKKPQIVKIALDEELLKESILRIMINYKSPYEVKSIHPGFVLFNSLGNPIFGSNTRFHGKKQIEKEQSDKSEGLIELIVPDLNLHSGYYRIDFWLGDEFYDFDYLENAFSFEFHSNNPYTSKPDPLLMGAIDKRCEWIIK
ncbi:MAG: ABC transporter ATP-binding protein [Chitinophagaceae bacterium]|nr:ABC transporter ATP-binding protein [Chitinophagaceae bacterium]